MKYEKFTDKQLIDKIRKGAREMQDAFNILHKRWVGKVYVRAYRMLSSKEDAEEITQEVFLSLFRMILRGGVKGEEPGRYIMRSTSNACINSMRHKKIGKKAVDEVINDKKNSGLNKKDTTPTSRALDKAIEKLKPKDKLLIIQKYFEKKTTKAIAGEVKRPKRVIDYHLERIRKILFQDLKKSGIQIQEI
ncbi:MAG TPA: sigma-70 family RNA polymerase sigma factor [Spirochaetota bacterium]|nr:sigma-70 family RNA polymerase sigma factor [Spirochaetota bacterium]